MFAWIDSAADWVGAAAKLELQGDMCSLVREWLVGQGFRVATTSMSELIRALDEALRHAELRAIARAAAGARVRSGETPRHAWVAAVVRPAHRRAALPRGN